MKASAPIDDTPETFPIARTVLIHCSQIPSI